MKYFFKDIRKSRWIFEPIDGCTVGCQYCHSFYWAKRKHIVNTLKEWLNPKYQPIDYVQIEKEIRIIQRSKISKDFIFCYGTTDAFHNDRSTEMVFQSIPFLNSHGLTTRLLTKRVLPNFILGFNPRLNEIGITINTYPLNKIQIKNILFLKKLKKLGFYIIISFQPFDLTLTDKEVRSILKQIGFVNHIVFGIYDHYTYSKNRKDFERAFQISDIMAEFCIKNQITFFNGSKNFRRVSRNRMRKMGIYKPLIFKLSKVPKVNT